MENSLDDRYRSAGTAQLLRFPHEAKKTITFDRREMTQILDLYGLNVATGEWRDYAMDFGPEKAVFSIFRRASEQPLYRIIKDPSLARKQGAYAILAQTGLVLRRGTELAQVLKVLVKKPKLSDP